MSTGLALPAQFKRVRLLQRKLAKPAPWECPDPITLAEMAGLSLDDWQKEAVSSKHPQLFLLASRQSGKSLVDALLAVHTVLSEPGAVALLISASQRQAGELFRACLSVYRALGRPIRAIRESALSLELANHSRIISLPATEDTTRGIPSPRLVIIDEAAHVPEAVYMSVRPMLAVSRGKLVLSSSAFGERGFFWEDWKERRLWDYYECPATECPRIDPEWLEAERERIGDWWFQSEYMCRFMSVEGAVFRPEDIEAIIKKDVLAWDLSNEKAG